MSEAPKLAIYIDPPSYHFLRDRLFDSETEAARLGGDNLMAPWTAVRDYFTARGVPVHTADQLELMAAADARALRQRLYVTAGMLDRYHTLGGRDDVIMSAFVMMECPIVEPTPYRNLPSIAPYFRRVMSWTDSESIRHFTKKPVDVEPFRFPQSYDRVHSESLEPRDRQFMVMINANKLPRVYWQELYTERLRAVEFFNRYNEVDLYGKGWDRMPSRVGRSIVPMTVRRIYRLSGLEERVWRIRQRLFPDPLYAAAASANRGIADSKREVLGRYRFALCFENMRLKGWVTEKIFDCFLAGTVPVYLGAPDILDWVPADCFIDMRQFEDYSELRTFLHALTPAQIEKYREAARAYIESSAFDPFRKQAFVDLFRRFVREDAGVDM